MVSLVGFIKKVNLVKLKNFTKILNQNLKIDFTWKSKDIMTITKLVLKNLT